MFTLASMTLDVQCVARQTNRHDVTTRRHPSSVINTEGRPASKCTADVTHNHHTNKPKQDGMGVSEHVTVGHPTPPTHCQPVPNEVLWQKLDMQMSSSTYRHRFSATGDEMLSDTPSLRKDASHTADSTRRNRRGTATVDRLQPQGQRRRRSLQVSTTESAAGVQDATKSAGGVLPSRIPGFLKLSALVTTGINSVNASHFELDMTELPSVNFNAAAATLRAKKGVYLNSSYINSLQAMRRRKIRSSRPAASRGGKRVSNNNSDTQAKLERRSTTVENKNQTKPNAGSKNSKVQLKSGDSNDKRLDRASWQCELRTEWTRMPDDMFPPFVETGVCVQKTCMMGMYACVPKQYVIKVLRRIDTACNLIGSQNTTSQMYEDAWALSDYSVIVGCDCSKRRKTGRFSISRTSDDADD